MHIAITGSHGLVGHSLAASASERGYRVTRVVRGEAGPREAHWDPIGRQMDIAALDGVDAVVHLAGENIAARRWTAAQRKRIRDSRIMGTSWLSESLASLPHPPQVLVSASAVGYYGDRGDTILDEDAGPGDGFLAEVARQWEEATAAAEAAGIRVVTARFGMILSCRGGALAKMLPPFRLGMGAVLGSGRQYVSWITLADTIAALWHLMEQTTYRGPVNCVAPEPVTNREFSMVLGRAVRRPVLLRVPAVVLRTALGALADELLLASTRAVPARLKADRFSFLHEQLTPDTVLADR